MTGHWKLILVVAAGGMIGSVARFAMAQAIQLRAHSGFPFGTLAVNVLGCFLIGIFLGASERWNLAPEWRLGLATGFCGGFTTFSAFSFETFQLFREGLYFFAAAYSAGSFLLCLAATSAGFLIARFS